MLENKINKGKQAYFISVSVLPISNLGMPECRLIRCVKIKFFKWVGGFS